MTTEEWQGNSQLVSSDSGVRPSLPAADLHKRAACCTGTERTVFPSDLHYSERTVHETIRVVVDDGYHVFAARAGVRPGDRRIAWQARQRDKEHGSGRREKGKGTGGAACFRPSQGGTPDRERSDRDWGWQGRRYRQETAESCTNPSAPEKATAPQGGKRAKEGIGSQIRASESLGIFLLCNCVGDLKEVRYSRLINCCRWLESLPGSP